MLAQNLALHALCLGYTARFVSASAMLTDLAAQDGAGRRTSSPRDARVGGLARDLERLQYLSTRQVEARESWGLTGSQALAEFLCQDADLGRKASAIEWLSKSGSYCSKHHYADFLNSLIALANSPKSA